MFYTDGTNVWDTNNSIMPNGYGLTGQATTTQAATIIQKPNSTSQYYIFTLDGIGTGESIFWDGLYFSDVDITHNTT